MNSLISNDKNEYIKTRCWFVLAAQFVVLTG